MVDRVRGATEEAGLPTITGSLDCEDCALVVVGARADWAMVRDIYLGAATAAVDLLSAPAIGRRWHEESILPGFVISGLAGHLARSVLQVEWFLDAPVGDEGPVSAERYYATLEGTTDPESPLNRRVRAEGNQVTADGHQALVERTMACLVRLRDRLVSEPVTRRVESFGRVLLLDEYLRTRLVELSVHVDDLARSVELPTPTLSPAALGEAARTLLGAAALRHGQLAVLRALAGRDRDNTDTLRVL